MKCEIERMEINYMFYFFTFLKKVIKKLLTFCYWQNRKIDFAFLRCQTSPFWYRDELAVMDGDKCIFQLRGVRTFLSNKYDSTRHKRYKELADANKKNEVDVEKYLNYNLTFSKDTEFEMLRIDVTEDEIRQIEIIN